MKRLLTWFFQGLLTLIPVVATFYLVWLIFTKLEPMFAWVGSRVHQSDSSPLATALGIALTVVLIVAVGAFASNFLGRRILAWIEDLVERLPLIKLLYGSIRDLLGAFVGDKKSFDRPVAVSLTGDQGAMVIGFITRDDLQFLGLGGHVAVYLPQSYNFAGNLVVFPRDRVQPLASTSSDVMAFLVSGGVSGKK